MSTPPFDLDRCRRGWIGLVSYRDEVASTNTWALDELACGGPSPGRLFLADRQTAGRGRGRNSWWSAGGSLTFSLVPPPLAIAEARSPLVSLAVGVALCRALEPLAPAAPVAMKWPNDVMLGGRKVSGVLIEISRQRPRRFVIGVGVNVGTRLVDAPSDVRQRATSLLEQRGDAAPADRTDVLVACLDEIESALKRLAASDSSLAREWRDRSLLTGMRVRVALPDREVAGACVSIADDGALVIETPSGVEAVYGGVVAEYG